MPARIDDVAQIGAVDQGLEQAFVQSDGSWDGCRGQHSAVKTAGQQARHDDGCAQYGRRNQRARSGEPQQKSWVAAKPRNDRRVDGVIERVRFGLVCE
jgi:hypothetical protein